MSDDVTPGTDPRVVRTRRDVVDAATAILMAQGWSAVTHGEVAKRAGYSKATLYTHWPTRSDLVEAAVTQICDSAGHPQPTGDLRGDLVRGLVDFADDLASGHLARVLGGVIERAGDDPVVGRMREQLYAAGTRSLDAVLRDHLAPVDVEPSLLLLVGGVLARASFQAGPIDEAYVADLVDRVLASVTLLDATPGSAG